MVVLAVNKPAGIVCTEERRGKETVLCVFWITRSGSRM